jgi:hypothetical protein
MSMQARVDDYLLIRRSLGCKLRGDGRMLVGFAAWLDDSWQATVTVPAALAWATQPQDAAPAHWRRRLSVVRGFARHLATLDPACQIPRQTCSRRHHTGPPRHPRPHSRRQHRCRRHLAATVRRRLGLLRRRHQPSSPAPFRSTTPRNAMPAVTSHARSHAAGLGIQTVPITNCAVTEMALKEKAIARTTPPATQAGRYQPSDKLLAFLTQL